jgi:peptidoglycan hydrolase-like protein with peptidoglycan-binding domain
MSYSLTWLPSVLKAAGLKVALEPGWEDRGRGPAGRIHGVICHHTGVKAAGNMPTLRALVNGRKAEPGLEALNGPLAHLGLGRDGTYYIVAAGRCNHAGKGQWHGVTDGNSTFIGIEAENDGKGEPWLPVQMEAYWRGVAAILMHEGLDHTCCAGHKEYKPTKSDPNFDMNAFRSHVAEIIAGTAPPPELTPIVEPPPHPGAPAGRPTLRRGASGDLVLRVQRLLAIEADGAYGRITEAAVREFQRQRGLVPDGRVGPETWPVLDPIP